MALRESSTRSGQTADLDIITGHAEDDGFVPHGALLAALAQAVARWHWDEVAQLRDRGARLLGAAQTSDAILVAAGFNGITRVADAIGIRLDRHTADASVELRAAIGIDAFAPAAKWQAGSAGDDGEEQARIARIVSDAE